MPRKGTSMKLNRQIVGNTGLYLTCYYLSLLGWNAMPTARNARGIDIVAYSLDGKRYIGIQVKSLSDNTNVPLGKSVDNIIGDFLVIITQVTSSKPTAFILTPEEIKKIIKSFKNKKGNVSHWLQPEEYNKEEFRNAWKKIGRGDSTA